MRGAGLEIVLVHVPDSAVEIELGYPSEREQAFQSVAGRSWVPVVHAKSGYCD